MEVSFDIRIVSEDGDWVIGLQLMETYERFAGIRINPTDNRQLKITLMDLTGAQTAIAPASGNTYRLAVKRTGPDQVSARVSDRQTGEVLAELQGLSSITPEGVVLFTAITNGDEGPVSFRIRRAI